MATEIKVARPGVVLRVSELIGIRIQDIDFDNLAVFGKARKNEKLY